MIAERRTALTLAAAITAATLGVAIVVRLALAVEVRRRLDFGFAGVPATPEAALSIFSANARLLAVVFAAIAITQIDWRRDATLPVALTDTLLVLEVALNTIVVGAALGAYGTRMLAAALPHGPIELAVFALALALYMRARRARASAPAHRRGRRHLCERPGARSGPGELRGIMTGARMFGLLLLAVSALALSALFAARLPDELSDAPAPGPAERHAPVTVPEMPRVLGVSLPVLIAAEAAVGTIGLDRPRRHADRPTGPATHPPRVRALRTASLAARRGQAPGPRGRDRGDRQHRPRLPHRPRPHRSALPRARTAPRHRGIR